MQHKIKIFVLLLFPVQVVFAQDTIIEGRKYLSFYKDTSGSAWTEEIRDLNPHGHYLEYYRDGTLKARGNYRNGNRVGHWMTFHPNGHNESDGILDKKFNEVSKWHYFFPDGTVKTQVFYRIRFSLFWGRGPFGPLSGFRNFKRVVPINEIREYYPNGELRCVVSYNRKGQLNDRSYYYYDNGKVQREEVWVKGENILIREYCRNGVLYSSRDFNDSQNDYNLKVGDGSCTCDFLEQVAPTFTLNHSGWPKYRFKF